MDRKGIIAIVISVLVMAGWAVHTSHEMAAYNQAKQAADAAAAAEAKAKAEQEGPAAEAPAPGATPKPTAAAPTPTPEEAVPEKLEELTTPSVKYSFTNLGGGIARAVLLKHIAESGGLQTGDRETKVTLNLYGMTPIGAVVERPGDPERRAAYTASVNAEGNEVTFERTDARQVQIRKKFTVPKGGSERDEYLVGFDLTFTNGATEAVQVPAYFVQIGSAGPIHRLDQANYTGYDWYDGTNHFKDVTGFTSGGIGPWGRTDQPIFSQSAANVGWVAVTNQYFCTLITPTNAKGTALWSEKFNLNETDVLALSNAASSQRGPLPAVEGALGMSGFSLAPGESVSQHFDLYAGPREYDRLKRLGGNQDEIMEFGTYIKIVSKALLSSMNWLHARLGSYAAAIIVLTLIIRSCMWPLQNKSTESMKKMQALTPKMNELKEKYQDDPQRMNQEVMKLYKEYGVNPLSGCLPMLIQIPIFWGLFRMLGKAVELRNSHFLWVHDLSQPDTVAVLLGKPLNILPLCMAATMFWQMKLSPKSGDAAQQKIFMFMPVIFVVFCYNYASALALYWTVQNLFSIGQLYVTRNKTTPVLQKIGGASKKKGTRKP